ncbi:MAG: glycerophosphodiester phosphodiesterase family protein [Planctomycetota bacterium]|nr:glycerophosphodiester phosphodiesterase family protein [Planctomycetota bacterium]
MSTPELVAHRGYAARYPENTLAALEAAIDAGARHVEVDVQLSADGFPVLFHDRTLDRMCGTSGAVHQKSLSELRALSCGEPGKFGDRFQREGLLSLAGFVQLLRRHPDVRAFVEIKRVAIEQFGRERILERVLPAIDAAIHQCTLISFSLEFLAAARRAHPIPLGAVFDRWEERENQLVPEIAPEFVFVDIDGLPATGDLRIAGARVVVYEVASPEIARALARRGVDMVETFQIAEMLAALRPGGS